MANYAIITDLNRCTGCLACTVACKAINGVDVGNFWIKTLRVGPHPIEGGSGTFPDVEMYFLPVQCQHCENPECVKVCPTEASHVAEDGTIQIDKDKCIGCQFCAMACPYGVRYLNQTERVVEKCTLCEPRRPRPLLRRPRSGRRELRSPGAPGHPRLPVRRDDQDPRQAQGLRGGLYRERHSSPHQQGQQPQAHVLVARGPEVEGVTTHGNSVAPYSLHLL